MLARRCRPWLALAVAAALGACELNPQPPIPGRDSPVDMSGESRAGSGAKPGAGTGGTSSATGGTLNSGMIDDESAGAATVTPPASAGGAGGFEPENEGGEGGTASETDGGAGGAEPTSPGGAGGAAPLR